MRGAPQTGAMLGYPSYGADIMIHLLFSPFYAATISIGPDGGMLISSSRERMLAWGIVFCLVAAGSLILWLFRIRRRWCMAAVAGSLLIPVFIMPSVRHEQIHVLRDRITVDTGAWYRPSLSTIDLSDLRDIRQDEMQFQLAGMIVEPNAVWHVNRGNGTRERVELNGFFTAHRMVVAQYLRDRGHIVEPRVTAASLEF